MIVAARAGVQPDTHLSGRGGDSLPRSAWDHSSALWASLTGRMFPIAARVVGSTRRRPLRLFVAWFAATWLPFGLANAAQLLVPLVLLWAWLIAGGRSQRHAVEAVTSLWDRRAGRAAGRRRGGFGIGARHRRGTL